MLTGTSRLCTTISKIPARSLQMTGPKSSKHFPSTTDQRPSTRRPHLVQREGNNQAVVGVRGVLIMVAKLEGRRTYQLHNQNYAVKHVAYGTLHVCQRHSELCKVHFCQALQHGIFCGVSEEGESAKFNQIMIPRLVGAC